MKQILGLACSPNSISDTKGLFHSLKLCYVAEKREGSNSNCSYRCRRRWTRGRPGDVNLHPKLSQKEQGKSFHLLSYMR